MKILHFHPDWQHAEKFIAPLIECEKSLGFDSQIIVERRAPIGEKNLKFDLNFFNIIIAPFLLLKLFLSIKHSNPDIVFAHNSRSSLLPMCAARLARIRNITYVNHGVPYVGYKGLTRQMLYFLEVLNCFVAKDVLTVSKHMRNLIRNISPAKTVKYIHNGSASGIDLDLFNPSQIEKINWREKNGYRHDDFIIGFVGRPVRRKGFFLAVDIWRLGLLEPGNKLALFGISDSDYKTCCPIQPLNVRPHGFVDNLHEILPHLDLLILPSWHEGFSYAILEAFASGILVMVGENISSTSIVRENINGLVVDDMSPEGFARKIKQVQSNKARTKVLRANGIKIAKRYDRKKFMRYYAQYLRSSVTENN